MGSAVNFRTTFSSFGFILSDIDIEDNCYSLHYYLCVMQDVKCARFSTSGSSAAQKKTIYKIKQTNKLPKVMNGPFLGVMLISNAHYGVTYCRSKMVVYMNSIYIKFLWSFIEILRNKTGKQAVIHSCLSFSYS